MNLLLYLLNVCRLRRKIILSGWITFNDQKNDGRREAMIQPMTGHPKPGSLLHSLEFPAISPAKNSKDYTELILNGYI